jgi:hypothetical protein
MDCTTFVKLVQICARSEGGSAFVSGLFKLTFSDGRPCAEHPLPFEASPFTAIDL